MNRKFTEEERGFVLANGEGRSTEDLTEMVNARFGTEHSVSSICSLRYRIGAKSGRDTRFRPGDEAGAEYRFRKGHQSCTKGRRWDEWMPKESQERSKAGWFRKGHSPHNKVPVGTEFVKNDGYLWRKIAEPNRWRQVHVLVWEESHGPVPEGMCLTFLDGDKGHVELDNLMLISKKENRLMNSPHSSSMRTSDTQMTKANIGLRRLTERIREVEKEG